MREMIPATDTTAAGIVARTGLADAMQAPAALFEFECIGADGSVKWRESVRNLVTTPGKTDIIDKYLKGSSYTAAWFVILAGAGTKAAGDTLASHAGWSEVTPYSGNRPAITWGTTSGGSNTSVATSIAITGTATVAGAGTSSVNSGTSGILYNVADFSASRSVVNGDTLNVTITLSVS
jgi:hypothetical protein